MKTAPTTRTGVAATIGAVMIAVVVSAGRAGAQVPPADADTVVLDTHGIWRMHCTLAPPVLASGETVRLKLAWLNYETAGPPKNWPAPDFDDRSWHRGPVTLACKSALVRRVCLRGSGKSRGEWVWS